MKRVSPEETNVVTGEKADEAAKKAEPKLADRPLFIYVTNGSETDGFDKIEKVVLDDNKVLVGMKAFNCVKMTPSDVNDDPLLSGKSKDDRYFLFVSRDYEKVQVVDGSHMKASTVYAAMKRFARRDYKTNLDRAVKSVLKLLTEFDKINNQRKVLDEKEKRLGDKMSRGEAHKIAKEKADLEKRQKEADAKRDELLKFELREAAT
jgi:hypothetical protein